MAVTEGTRGSLIAFHAIATLDNGETVDSPVVWSVTGAESGATSIGQDGILHIGGDEGDSLTITATTTWIDPVAGANAISKTLTLTITGDPIPEWPKEHGHDDDPVTP